MRYQMSDSRVTGGASWGALFRYAGLTRYVHHTSHIRASFVSLRLMRRAA